MTVLTHQLLSFTGKDLPFGQYLSPFGCYNRIPHSEWLRNTRNLFLTVQESGKSKIKVLANSVSGESLLLDSETAIFPLCPHMGKGMGNFSGVTFIRPLDEDSTS